MLVKLIEMYKIIELKWLKRSMVKLKYKKLKPKEDHCINYFSFNN